MEQRVISLLSLISICAASALNARHSQNKIKKFTAKYLQQGFSEKIIYPHRHLTKVRLSQGTWKM